jgi:hypothetical protein
MRHNPVHYSESIYSKPRLLLRKFLLSSCSNTAVFSYGFRNTKDCCIPKEMFVLMFYIVRGCNLTSAEEHFMY